MKKSLTVLLVLLLLLTPSLAVSADEDTIIYTEGTLYYTVEN